MNLKIKAIRYSNIREFNDLELDFTGDDGDPHHISLVQMPNGTGKTTTMGLIRNVLLGRELEPEEVMTYQPQEFNAIEGSFEADFESGDERFTIRLELDYETGDASYRHTKPQRSAGGDMPGHYLPTELDNIITESFTDLFVFNGELTEEFIQRGSSEAEDALKVVNYLNRIEYQQKQIDSVVEKRQESKSVTTEQGYKNIKTNLDKFKTRLKELQINKSTLKEEISEHKEKIESLNENRTDILAENRDQLEKDNRLQTEIQKLETDLQNKTERVLGRMRKPSQLDSDINDDLDQLFEGMEIMELPKSTSQEFFVSLSESDTCVCDRPIKEEHQENILANAKKYLTEDDIGVLNSLKDHIRGIPDYQIQDSAFKELEDLRENLMQKKQERAAIDLEDPDLNEKLERISNQKADHQRKKEEKEEQLEWITTTDANLQEEMGLDWKTNTHLCKQRQEEYEQKLREASETVNFGRKADLLKQMFGEFVERTLDHLKQEQIRETNEKLDQILGLSRVQVEDIDDSIIIEGRDSASEGQSLSIAYAYLSTLFEDSAISVPFVIDSPAVSIDYDKREEVAHIISDLFDQLIIFVISPERESFVNELQSDDINYCTVFKESSGEITKDRSVDFFMDFQSEEAVEEVS